MKQKFKNIVKLIRITFEKPVNGGIEKKEIILTGYGGVVLISLALLVAVTLLVLFGVKLY
jgi:hypothetical protein